MEESSVIDVMCGDHETRIKKPSQRSVDFCQDPKLLSLSSNSLARVSCDAFDRYSSASLKGRLCIGMIIAREWASDMPVKDRNRPFSQVPI